MFAKLFKTQKQLSNTILLVSGLPRSGTSMMMKMLEAGGMPPLTDNIRTADADNPKGYYEFERAKKLREGDQEWLKDVGSRAVKIISALLEYLPSDYRYKVIFMRRAMPEILASQKKMLTNRGEDPNKVDDAEMARVFENHLEKVARWLAAQPNFEVLYVQYNDLLADPETQIGRIVSFLGNGLDTWKMAEVIDPQLYRHRKKN